MTAARGTGTKRERRPGVWEIRVAAGTDPVTGRTIQRSVTFHGTETDADTYRVELAGEYAARRSIARAAPLLTVGDLLDRWLAADHPWKPSTWSSHRSNARFLSADKLASTRVTTLTPQRVRDTLVRWEADGATLSVRAGRFRVLRSAIGWAYDERIIDHHPIRTMRGPGRSEPRRPLPDADVTALFTAASTALLEAVANDTTPGPSSWRRHVAEQDLLLLRLAADTGARRGELAALRFDDLDARTLTIRRAISGTEITTPKSGHGRSLTIGATTAAIWTRLHDEWSAEAQLGPWVFSGRRDHQRPNTPSALGHRFARLRTAARVPDATLHRLRHNVATFLVGRGEILQAQARLGHRDAATTLREYSYALPGTDVDIADAIDRHLNQPSPETEWSHHDTER
jgi:integrase